MAETQAHGNEPLLVADNLSKSYGRIVACRDREPSAKPVGKGAPVAASFERRACRTTGDAPRETDMVHGVAWEAGFEILASTAKLVFDRAVSRARILCGAARVARHTSQLRVPLGSVEESFAAGRCHVRDRAGARLFVGVEPQRV